MHVNLGLWEMRYYVGNMLRIMGAFVENYQGFVENLVIGKIISIIY